MTTRTERCAGILLHPTSLPGRFGVGDFGPDAERFLEWAAFGGLRIWQVLPLNPTGYGNSPYGALSSFAGNPLLISPERLVEDGILPAGVLETSPSASPDRIEFGPAVLWKEEVLRTSWKYFLRHSFNLLEAFEMFKVNPAQRSWLDDWALFSALKTNHRGQEWPEWEPSLARRDKEGLAQAQEELAEEIEYQKFVQFLFFRQWERIRAKARELGIQILGDIPIYVAYDSADVWSNQNLFDLDENSQPVVVAGVPPDYFSVTGQRWGNPLYRWDRLAETRYAWWIERIRANLRLADLIRLDHFRAFAKYWEIPASESTAILGRWLPGPGKALFDAIHEALGTLPLIAEDLGLITHDVEQLRLDIGAPGMKVLQFAFSEPDSPHLPHHHVHDMVVYTGTHDNDTTRGWFDSLDAVERARVQEYVGSGKEQIEWQMIRAAYTSVADRAVIPAQDVFGLGSEARMNKPGHPEDNWAWRAPWERFSHDAGQRLRRLAEISGRIR